LLRARFPSVDRAHFHHVILIPYYFQGALLDIFQLAKSALGKLTRQLSREQQQQQQQQQQSSSYLRAESTSSQQLNSSSSITAGGGLTQSTFIATGSKREINREENLIRLTTAVGTWTALQLALLGLLRLGLGLSDYDSTGGQERSYKDGELSASAALSAATSKEPVPPASVPEESSTPTVAAKIHTPAVGVAPVSVPVVSASSVCALCGVTIAKLSRCSRCKTAAYCSREHQSKHWAAHKVSTISSPRIYCRTDEMLFQRAKILACYDH
jgi:hypothetical protein